MNVDIKDRIATGDDLFYMQDVGDGRVRLVPAPDVIVEQGTPLNKELLQPIVNDVSIIYKTTCTKDKKPKVSTIKSGIATQMLDDIRNGRNVVLQIFSSNVLTFTVLPEAVLANSSNEQIVVFSLNTTSQAFKLLLNTSSGVFEIEELAFDKNSVVPIKNGGTNATSLLAVADTLGFPSFYKATQLEAETDLNSIVTFGNYKCTSASRVATLKNCPTKNAFRMYVYSPAPDVAGYIAQDITDLHGNKIYRRSYDGGLTWKIDRTYLDDVIVNDYITETGIDGEWTYRKWKSGLVEAWGRLLGSKVVKVEPEGDYPRIEVQATFPSVFDRVDVINATPSGDKTPFGISRAVSTEGNGKLNFTIYVVPDYIDDFSVGDILHINCDIKGI